MNDDEIKAVKMPPEIYQDSMRANMLTEEVMRLQRGIIEGQVGQLFQIQQLCSHGQYAEAIKVIADARDKTRNSIDSLNVLAFERDMLMKRVAEASRQVAAEFDEINPGQVELPTDVEEAPAAESNVVPIKPHPH